MNYVTPIVMALLIFLNVIQYEHSESLDADIHTYQQQISMLKIASEQQQEDTTLAYNSAKAQMRQIQDKTQSILRAKVSSNCDQSIKWLIQQAHSL